MGQFIGDSYWRWHVDEVFVKITRHYLWRPEDHEGEILESYVTKKRDKRAAFRFSNKAMKRHGKAKKFGSVRASFYNHFNLERYLIDRQTYKYRRSTA